MAPTECLPSACLPAYLFACMLTCFLACFFACMLACLPALEPPGLFRMLLELIFTVIILQNIPHACTDARTRSPLLGLLVGAKNC